jgi:hypothetical protein
VAGHLPHMCKALALIPGNGERKSFSILEPDCSVARDKTGTNGSQWPQETHQAPASLWKDGCFEYIEMPMPRKRMTPMGHHCSRIPGGTRKSSALFPVHLVSKQHRALLSHHLKHITE